MDLRQIKVDPTEFGMMSYDPAYNNTASCMSRITYIDGDAGILRYRGYPIEELAEKSTYLETAYLLLHGELPTAAQLKDWTYNVTHHTFIHESIKKFLDGFHYDAHPMGMMISTIAALSTFYHDAKDIFNAESRRKQTYRLVGKMPTIAAFSYRHTLGMPFVYPDNELSYPGNFLNMLFRTSETRTGRIPRWSMRWIFFSSCTRTTSRIARRTRSAASEARTSIRTARPRLRSRRFTARCMAARTKKCCACCCEIGSVQKVPEFIKRVKAGETKLMGFGHRVYKNYDPRARIIKKSGLRSFRTDGQESAAGNCVGVRAHCS